MPEHSAVVVLAFQAKIVEAMMSEHSLGAVDFDVWHLEAYVSLLEDPQSRCRSVWIIGR